MRILMTCPTYPPREQTCGVGDYTRCLSEELVRQGEEVSILTAPGYRAERGTNAPLLVRVAAGSVRDAVQATWSREHRGADVIHLQYTPDLYRHQRGLLLLPLLARLRRRDAPAVVTFHTLVGPSPATRVTAVLMLAACRVAISANEEVTALVRRRLPRLSQRLVEIPIGANIPAQPDTGAGCKDGRELLGLPPDATLLVHFGLVYPGKGIETLFEAMAVLAHQRPEVHLAIVGDTRPPDLPYRRSLEALATRLGVASAIVWAGRRGAAEVSRILRSADVFVVPFDGGASLRRGSLMAGLAHGVPVLSTRAPLSSTYLQDGDNISLVPPRDPQALAHRILTLLDCPAEAERLARGARALAERFSWDRIAQETRTVYARVWRS